MPLAFNIFQNATNILVWHLNENLNFLETLIWQNLTSEEKKKYLNFKDENRKKQWLATRIIVKKFIGYYKPINYNEFGKPFLDSLLNISISHSEAVVAVSFSKCIHSIDIQKISPKAQIVSSKFIGKEETKFVKHSDDFSLIWCLKEAAYKFYAKKQLRFKENIVIKNLKNNLAIINLKKGNENFFIKIFVSKLKDYFLCLAQRKII